MNFNGLNLKRSYSSDEDDILNDFYIPILEQALRYYRLAGFFSSSSLVAAATGILPFIKNGGIMKMVTSVHIPPGDYDLITSLVEPNSLRLVELLNMELNDLELDLANRNHIRAMGWMLAHDQLEIKVAIPHEAFPGDEKIFHQKVGVLGDSLGNTISFSGSINESAAAWLGNIEEFKVFCSWNDVESDYVATDYRIFERFWNNESPGATVIELPTAVQQELLQRAPDTLDELCLDQWYRKVVYKNRRELFGHQQTAIDAWFEAGLRGIFEMATGSGKTLTAIAAADRVKMANKPLIIVLACPQSHLLKQWEDEMTEYELSVDQTLYADSTNPKWKDQLVDILADLSMGYKKTGLVMTTHRTASSPFFRSAVDGLATSVETLFIADEMHGLGASKSRQALLPRYQYRIGLSATVERQFDDNGTQFLLDYFGGIVSQFTLRDGIDSINPLTGLSYLTPFSYHPRFVGLTEDELDEYLKLTNRIIRMMGRASVDQETRDRLETQLFKRANIVKNAELKYVCLEEILDELAGQLNGTIIYCSPQQIEPVLRILSERRIKTHPFTMAEGTVPDKQFNGRSEREYILHHFGQGNYEVLVAMKCLDEGVNVPQASKMILMASSGNKREYIQRIGRVIRRFPKKEEAYIYDLVAANSIELLPPALHKIERDILEKELKRYSEIAQYASNPAEVMKLIATLRRKMGV